MVLRPKGFTLVELIIVLIIISILATLGFAGYTEIMERARNVEAINILRGWMNAIQMYYLENNSLDGVDLNSFRPLECVGCSSQYYFRYNGTLLTGSAPTYDLRLIAERCLADGKPPQGTKTRYVCMDWDAEGNRTRVVVSYTPYTVEPF